MLFFNAFPRHDIFETLQDDKLFLRNVIIELIIDALADSIASLGLFLH